MVCPECGDEVYYEHKTCRCEKEETQLGLDVDDLGTIGKMSVENMVVKWPTDGRKYRLQMKLYAGPCVEYKVFVKHFGKDVKTYKMKPHSYVEEIVNIFEAMFDGQR